MNKKGFFRGVCSCALVACLPLAALAADSNELTLDKQFNGLNIDAQLVGSSDTGGQGAGSGVQALKVTNNDSVVVVCQLQPGPAESTDSASPPTSLEPGKSGTLRVDGKYTGTPLKATLACRKK